GPVGRSRNDLTSSRVPSGFERHTRKGRVATEPEISDTARKTAASVRACCRVTDAPSKSAGTPRSARRAGSERGTTARSSVSGLSWRFLPPVPPENQPTKPPPKGAEADGLSSPSAQRPLPNKRRQLARTHDDRIPSCRRELSFGPP